MTLHQRIYTPGPVIMSDETLRLGGEQAPYFRNKNFSKIIFECEDLLIKLTNAPPNSRVIFLTASGTGAMEMAVANFISPKGFALVVNGGGFGQRFVDLCHTYQIQQIEEIHPGKGNLDHLGFNNNFKHADTLLINAHETTTGILYDLDAVGKFCKKNKLLNIVDAISMFVTDPLDMVKQNIDILIISSHKGLALPPGLSMLIVAPPALEKTRDDCPSLYLNAQLYLQNGKRGQTPFTPAVTTILQLHQRLKYIENEGIRRHQEKAEELASYFRSQIKSLPLSHYTDFMPNAMTTLTPTDGKRAIDIVQSLADDYGLTVTPSGGDLKNIMFRISHMGEQQQADLDILIDALYDYYGVKR